MYIIYVDTVYVDTDHFITHSKRQRWNAILNVIEHKETDACWSIVIIVYVCVLFVIDFQLIFWIE